MAYNGLGTFVRFYSWITDRDSNVKIRADRMDAEMDGFATGLSNCITKDGQTTPTASLKMGGFNHTNVGNATAWNHYAAARQVQYNSFIWCGTSGGTANAHTLSPSPLIASYAAGQEFWFLPNATNTASFVTVTTSALTPRGLKKSIGGALVELAVGDLKQNVPAHIVDEGTQYVLQNPQTHAQGADIASASTLDLSGVTGDCVDVTGTTGITAITLAEGRQVTVRFTGILTLTHGSSLVLPKSSNITTAAGDYAIFRGYASGVVRCVTYTNPVIPYVSATSSGPSSLDFFEDTDNGTNKVTLSAPASISSDSIIILPGSTSTLATLAGTETFTNKTLTTPIVSGITSGAAASAGNIGEIIESIIASGSATSLTTNTPKNITSITLTAGEWELTGAVQFASAASTVVSSIDASISTTSATHDSSADRYVAFSTNGITPGSGFPLTLKPGPITVNISSGGTYYLVGRAVFTTSTETAWGFIRARRIR